MSISMVNGVPVIGGEDERVISPALSPRERIDAALATRDGRRLEEVLDSLETQGLLTAELRSYATRPLGGGPMCHPLVRPDK